MSAERPLTGPREQIGPYTVDWVGPTVERALEAWRALLPFVTPATRTACLEDARLVDRLLRETSRRYDDTRSVLGGRTGAGVVATVHRLLARARADGAGMAAARRALEVPEPDDGLEAGLDQLLARLADALATLAAERAE
jgi:hypothetical protein